MEHFEQRILRAISKNLPCQYLPIAALQPESANKFWSSGTGPPLLERGEDVANFIVGRTSTTQVSAATDVRELSRTPRGFL